ncbi:MAG: hypothetical protein N2572_04575 [Syntrophales bacterium]|nr:hypothetical protein [Syntrophales bacterium]
MDKGSVTAEESLKSILDTFKESFIGELVPGIVHNFANPLNGIMGRAQIMERRLKEMIARFEKEHPAITAEYTPVFEKLKRDISAINQESDRFFSMFRDVSDKFNALQCATVERIDFARLLSLELRFAEHYLEFKHGVIKEMVPFDGQLEIQGPPRIYSVALWGLFRYVHQRMGKGKTNRLKVEVAKEAECVRLDLTYDVAGNVPLMEAGYEGLLKNVSDILSPRGAKIEVKSLPPQEVLSVFFPLLS